MSLFVLNVENKNETTVLGIFKTEKLAKDAASNYVEGKLYKKKQSKKEDVRKVLYMEDVKENPVVLAMTSVPFELSTKKAKKDPNAPKKGLSPFFIFAGEHRPRITAENPDAKFSEIGKLVGQAWKALDENAKKVYVEKSESDKKRYELELSNVTVTEQPSKPTPSELPVKTKSVQPVDEKQPKKRVVKSKA